MINSADQYEFVTGDLDKIKINGEIMPLRDDDKKNILRGEDVAFLMEATQERRGIFNESFAQIKTFSKKVCDDNFRKINLYWHTGQRSWIIDDFDFGTFVTDGNKSFYDVYSGAFDIGSSKSYGSYTWIGGPIRRKHIENLFYDASKTVRGHHSVVWGSEMNYPTINLVEFNPDIGKAGGEWNPRMPGSIYNNIWAYCMESWGGRYWEVSNQGTAKWRSTGEIVSYSNKFSKSADIIVRFGVSSDYYSETQSDVDKDVWMKVGTQEGDSYSLSYDTLANMVESQILPLAGVPVLPYPGRSEWEGLGRFQDAYVSILEIYFIMRLRDRTRWD